MPLSNVEKEVLRLAYAKARTEKRRRKALEKAGYSFKDKEYMRVETLWEKASERLDDAIEALNR